MTVQQWVFFTSLLGGFGLMVLTLIFMVLFGFYKRTWMKQTIDMLHALATFVLIPAGVMLVFILIFSFFGVEMKALDCKKTTTPAVGVGPPAP